MIVEAQDFLDESRSLEALIADLSDEQLAAPTAFKDWSINRVIRHLHMWNYAAHMGLTDPDGFDEFFAGIAKGMAGSSMGAVEAEWCPLEGRALVEAWSDYLSPMTEAFADADPKVRVKWAGPSMSARSSISARLMETWAHGQEVYDHLGVVRANKDHIRSICVLGTNTFGWTYATRGETPPGARPYVRLTAPSGAIWEFGEPSDDERIDGKAEEFCQTVTQVRNIADTDLQVTGAVATDWMSKAQCFAGGAETPPAPGTRFTR